MNPVILNPPLKRGGVDVIAISHKTKQLKFIVHLVGEPEDAKSPEIMQMARKKSETMLIYLDAEGFIVLDVTNQWNVMISINFHPPQGGQLQPA